MVRSTVVVALVLLVLIQTVFVESWWWQRRRKRNCSYPKPTQGNSISTSSDYFYGDMSLWDAKKGKRTIVKNTWRLRHSLLLFRGVIFEWGINYNYYMGRSLNDCKIKWSWGRKGESRCRLRDAQNWTKAYKREYGRYRLLRNNCHNFVNRLGKYLDTNCGH